MKNFIITLMGLMFSVVVLGQSQSNYASSSKFTDNLSVTLQGGSLTTMKNFYAGHIAMTPIVTVGADKFITPWLGVGLDARTVIGTGEIDKARFNKHTMFDAVNLSGYVKLNVLNLFNFTGNRKTFEPIIYVGPGWGHTTCTDAGNYGYPWNESIEAYPDGKYGEQNYMTFRVGSELNLNLGKKKLWAITLNPSVVYGNIRDMRLVRNHGHFEVNAGVIYHFKTSNHTSTFAKAQLYNQSKIDSLNLIINDLKSKNNSPIIKEVEKTIVKYDTTYVLPNIQFDLNNSEIPETSLLFINSLTDYLKTNNKVYNVIGFASIEGNEDYNKTLSEKRANSVKKKLVEGGINENRLIVLPMGATDRYGEILTLNRVVVIEEKK